MLVVNEADEVGALVDDVVLAASHLESVRVSIDTHSPATRMIIARTETSTYPSNGSFDGQCPLGLMIVRFGVISLYRNAKVFARSEHVSCLYRPRGDSCTELHYSKFSISLNSKIQRWTIKLGVCYWIGILDISGA